MTADADARLLNWRFLVPPEPPGLLLLPAAGETVPGAVIPEPDLLDRLLPAGRYPAIAIPDLAAWLPRRRRGSQPARLLAGLAAAVAPGGWLCAGFANSLYPAAPLRPGSLSCARALRTIARAGLTQPELYAALPGPRRAAYLVPLTRPAELDHMLRVLFETSSPPPGRGAAASRRILALMRQAALAAPRARRHLMPAYYLIARRPR
jgi:hypothetical protein